MSDCLTLRERHFAPGLQPALAPEMAAHLLTCHECRLAEQGLAEADRALTELGNLPVTVPAYDAIAPAAATAARRQRRRQTVHRSAPYVYTALGTAALAAGLVVAFLVSRAHQLAPKLLAPGVELRVTGDAKSAVLGNGVRIRLESGTLKLAAANKERHSLLLPLGRVFLEVPKLAPGSSLSVHTPDAEVRVHGTRFQVIRTSKDTQVNVVEGVVEVRPEGIGRPVQLVRAGESATVGSAEAYRESLRQATLVALDHGEFGTAEKQIGQLLGSSPEPSQQAEAQALLAWSLSARGKRDEAITRYRQVLTLLPEGQQPLWAENACAELAILVEQQRPRESAPLWAECLRRFPDGVHAALARSRVHSSR
jgi:ferric-dicitrate binding protein FerR (iron transport regulator)